VATSRQLQLAHDTCRSVYDGAVLPGVSACVRNSGDRETLVFRTSAGPRCDRLNSIGYRRAIGTGFSNGDAPVAQLDRASAIPGHRGRRSSIGSLVCGALVAMLNAMAPTTSHALVTSFTLRQCRHALALSQSRFAAQLGVSLETYRTWDSGRRPVRPDVLARANELALRADPHALRPLETLGARAARNTSPALASSRRAIRVTRGSRRS
jgi:DNA-binding XRE family transcriptional regulator